MIDIIDKYLNNEEKEEFLKIVKNIIEHKEFKIRNTKPFMHHGKITLSSHIIEVSVLSYKEAKKKKADVFLTVIIALMHDMYSIPWQNNSKSKVKHFCNKHGFRHPIEAVINSINWFPDYFKDDNKSYIIIDSIIHHMYHLGVRVFDKNIDNLELKNNKELLNIDKKYIDMMIKSTSRGKIFNFSISRPSFIEGRIVSKCDKKVSFSQIKSFHNLIALLTGKNKSI